MSKEFQRPLTQGVFIEAPPDPTNLRDTWHGMAFPLALVAIGITSLYLIGLLARAGA